MNIIFLDIDGVLRTHNSDLEWSRLSGQPIPPIVFNRRFSKEAIGALNYACHITRAKIVISSTWRTQHELNRLKQVFIDNGFTGEIIGYTPIGFNRGEEIVEWLDTNNVNRFAVVDDSVRDILKHINPKYVVQIDTTIGC